MGTIKQKPNDDWRSRRSQEQLAGGGLPLNAEWRLRRLTEGRRLFTSFLTVNELALTSTVGVRPLGQVMGSSSYHVGWRLQPAMKSMEMTELSVAQSRVRRLALSRLQQEAQTLGARAVLGVRLETKAEVAGTAVLEVTAVGTAVGWHEARPPTIPVLCALSGQEFFALRQAGYRPVGLVLGISVFCRVGTPQTRSVAQGGLLSGASRVNQELGDDTDALIRTRRRAIRRLEEDAACTKATGVVGISLTKMMETRDVDFEFNEQKIKRRDIIVHCTAVGTAIAPFTDHTPPVFPILPLGK